MYEYNIYIGNAPHICICNCIVLIPTDALIMDYILASIAKSIARVTRLASNVLVVKTRKNLKVTDIPKVAVA